jgi:putative transposase
MRVYRRNLPHWRQPGVTYFLTFRLRDAVPAEALVEVQRERDSWLHRLSTAPEKREDQTLETLLEEYQAFLLKTYRRLEKVMDAGHGSCLLRDESLRNTVSNALLFFHGKRYEMHGCTDSS